MVFGKTYEMIIELMTYNTEISIINNKERYIYLSKNCAFNIYYVYRTLLNIT